MNPIPMPQVLFAYPHPETCGVALSLDQSPFGISSTTPTIYVSRQERAPLGRGLNRQVDVLVERLLAARHIVGVIITGAEDGNYIILNLGGDPTSAPTSTLLERLVHLTNVLNRMAGSGPYVKSVGRQRADLMDLDRPDRKRWNEASDLVTGKVREELVEAFNRALNNIPVDPEALPLGSDPDNGRDHGDDAEE